MKDDRGLPLESIKALYRGERYHSIANLPAADENTIKSRILGTDSSLSCVSTEPLHFDHVSTEVDETFNTSIKSIDYYGDSECEMDSESDFDESFCVGRNRYSSYHSVDEFSDDETTMDANSLHFNDSDLLPVKENFTPIFGTLDKDDGNAFFNVMGSVDIGSGANKDTGFHGQYLKLDSCAAGGNCSYGHVNTSRPTSSASFANQQCFDPVGKRTRSNVRM